MERMSDGILSERLFTLYILAKEMEDELQLADGDIDLNRRLKTIREYPSMIGDYTTKYNAISEQLAEYADVKKLLDFIFDAAIRDPLLIIGLAERLGLSQAFRPMPGRMKKRI